MIRNAIAALVSQLTLQLLLDEMHLTHDSVAAYRHRFYYIAVRPYCEMP